MSYSPTSINGTRIASAPLQTDYLPPQNIEAEEAILGNILFDPGAMERIVDLLSPEVFYVSAHQEIYRAALTLFRSSMPTDFMMVISYLTDHQKLEQVGGTGKLVQLLDRTVSAVNIDRYAALVVDKYRRRQLIQEANSIAAIAYDNTLDFKEIIDQAEQQIFTLAQPNSAQEVEPVADILIRNFNEIERYATGVVQPGLNTGLTEIDDLTGGLQRQELIIIGGRPSTGKTSFATNLAYNIALLHNLPVIIFSLEMSSEQLTYRLLSPLARIEYERLKAGRISLGELEPLFIAISKLSELPIFIDNSSDPSPLEIRAKVRRIAAKHGQLGLVLIDYLQLMGRSENANRVQELDRITRDLKQLAKDFDVPVICLSQLHRGVETRQDKRPMMSDLRDSGGIEQAADLIALLYREDYYQSDSPERGIVEVNFAKHRNGRTGVVKLLFEKEYSRFLDLYYR
jgi:replicative DNA helicase